MRYLIVFYGVFGVLWTYAQTPDTTQKQQELGAITVHQQKVQFTSPEVKNTTTEEAMDAIPGVTLIRRGNFAQELTYRGMSAGQLNVTIDGMQLFGACTDRMDPVSSYIEPNNLSGISLNNTSGSYGNQVGAQVDFQRTKATLGEKQKWSGSVGAAGGTNGWENRMFGSVQYSQKRFAFLVNGIYRSSENYTDGNGNEILYSQYRKWNGGASLAFAPAKNHEIVLDYLQDEGYDIGYPALTMDVSFAKAKIGSVTYSVDRPGQRWRKFSMKLYGNFIDHAMDDSKRPDSLVPIRMDMPGTSLTFGGFARTMYKLATKHLLEVEVAAFQNDLHAEMTMYPDIGSDMFMLTIPDAQRRQASVLLKDKFYISQKLKLEASLVLAFAQSDITTEMGRKTLTSFFADDPFQQTLLPSFSVRADYQISKQFSATSTVSWRERKGSLQELYGFFLYNRPDGFDYIGNPLLETEKALTANVDFHFKSEKWHLQASGFYNHFNDYIVGLIEPDFSAMTAGAFGVKQCQNLTSASSYGFEGSVHYQPVSWFQITNTSQWMQAIDSEGNFLPMIPPFTNNITAQVAWKKWEFEGSLQSGAAQNNVSTEAYGETTTPSFHVVNARLSRPFLLSKRELILCLEANNIFDVYFVEHLDVQKIGRMGRNFRLKVSYQF